MGNVSTLTRVVNVLSILKKTGQIISYDALGSAVTNGTLMDDGHYQKGISPNYTRDDENDMVRDNLTGLVWQDDIAVASVQKQWLSDANYATCDNNNSDPCFNTTGDTATTYCTELVLGGHEDWRLPTSVELEGIINYGASNPVIDSAKFNNTASSNYWWSTSIVGLEDNVGIVDFRYGNVSSSNRNSSFYVRCVRDGE